jgi:hypothetical protein
MSDMTWFKAMAKWNELKTRLPQICAYDEYIDSLTKDKEGALIIDMYRTHLDLRHLRTGKVDLPEGK